MPGEEVPKDRRFAAFTLEGAHRRFVAMVQDIKDAWRRDKSQWLIKTGVCSTLLLGTSALYAHKLLSSLRATGCSTDSMLLGFGAVYTGRLLLSMHVFQSRPPDWHEVPIVYMAFIPSIFATFVVARAPTAVCDARHYAAALLYAAGSALSSVSEYQRYVFKANPANKGKLMTTGLWAMSMHINYLGDSVLFTGWTLAAVGAWWAWWVPVVITVLFVKMHIPGLDEYLKDRYPKEFPAYAARTAKFLPGIY